MAPGDYVTISGATGTIDNIPAASINIEHRVDTVPTASSFTVMTDTQCTAGSVTGGGAAVVSTPQINAGLDTFTEGSGWGSGAWGGGSWGSGSTLTSSNQLRLWSVDNYGDDLLAAVRQGAPYYWDESDGVGTRAKYLHELTRRSVTLTDDPLSMNTTTTVTVTGHIWSWCWRRRQGGDRWCAGRS